MSTGRAFHETLGCMENVREQFATNLRRRREQLGLTQNALAMSCGLHRTEISLLERCRRSPQLETIVLLARGLELPPRDLIDGVG